MTFEQLRRIRKGPSRSTFYSDQLNTPRQVTCPTDNAVTTIVLTQKTDSLTDRPKVDWKQITGLIVAVPGSLILGFVGVMLYVAYEEHDQLYWSRLYRARSEISAMVGAA